MRTIARILPSVIVLASSSSLFAGGGQSPAQQTQPDVKRLTHVSYDATRELFQEINPRFASHLKASQNIVADIAQSHGGSGKQAQAVVDGLEADVVTLALAPDVDLLAQNQLVSPDWQEKFEFGSSPYTSTIVFVVRSGNPKRVKDWADLIRSDVELVTANPKTSGGARWSYLAAWGYAQEAKDASESSPEAFVKQLFQRVVALDSGARGATISFAEKRVGDVLITWESEAFQILEAYPQDQYEIIVPSISIQAEPVVALVDKVVDAKGTRAVATEYLNFLYTEEAQDIIARSHFRPRNEAILKKYEDSLKPLPLFTVDDLFGGWEAANERHFSEGGKLDQILSEVGSK